MRDCSVARTTSNFCKAPPSMASTWTFGLLEGEAQESRTLHLLTNLGVRPWAQPR